MLSGRREEGLRRSHGPGALGASEELAGPALLLASDAGSYITGQTLVVDGARCKTF